MKAVGVRELNAQLSRYLRDVQAGEVVLVTDLGRPHDPALYSAKPKLTRPVPEGTAQRLLDEERDERL